MKEIKSIILAAGKGTRMKSNKPKVLHEIFEKPLLGWVIEAIQGLENNSESIVVIGCGADEVETYLTSKYKNVSTVLQKEQLGTGHAVAQALPKLENFDGNIIITCGDTPLITTKSLKEFVDYHNENNSDLTVMTTKFDNPFGYGRIVRNEKNEIEKIVEQKDANSEIASINEVNTGIYLLNWAKIKKAFNELKNDNAQNEYYLTDIVKWAKDKKYNVLGYINPNNTEIYGINSRKNLEVAFNYMNERYLDELMDEGVTIVDKKSTYISPETKILPDTIIYPNTYIEGKNTISSNCKIGPMSHLRGNCEIGENCKIGNFVELKNAKVANNTKICHLSYVGDATLGSNINIGAGTIFANYNSITKEKKKTILQDGVSIGSNSVLVAPLEIKKDAFVAALSCITKDIDESSLAMTRCPQREVKDWVKKQKGEKKNES